MVAIVLFNRIDIVERAVLPGKERMVKILHDPTDSLAQITITTPRGKVTAIWVEFSQLKNAIAGMK